MSNSKNFKITVTAVRNRKNWVTVTATPKRKQKSYKPDDYKPRNEVDALQDQLCEILCNPLIDRLPEPEVFRGVIGFALKDLPIVCRA